MESTLGEINHGDYVNQTEIRVIGMSRSGNHAIINWIYQQSEGRVCFLNCVEGKTNPFYSARPIHEEQVYQANYADFILEQEQAGNFSQKSCLIYSYEDSFLRHALHPSFEENHDRFVGPSRQRYDMLILRDPFNLFASRLRSGIHGQSLKTDVRIWKQHAREFLSQRSHLRHNPTLVNYNTWCQDRRYREQLAHRLGLTFTDEGFNRVPKVGSGSSFDGHRFDGNATNMKVLERWKHYANDPAYRRIMQDEQLTSFSERIFGKIPGTERLYAQPMRSAAD